MRKQPFLEARPERRPETRGPLALCSVIIQTRASRASLFLVDVRTAATADRRTPLSDGSCSRLSYSRARPTRARRGSRPGPRPPRCARRADPAGSRCWSSILPIAIDTGFLPRDLGQLDDQVAEGGRDDAAARPGSARSLESAHEPRPQRVGGQRRLQARAASSGRSSVDRSSAPRPSCSIGVHDAFADAARRHVDHAPQAHVVVRVDDEAHVGERVLDLLPLVEPDAADDLVGDALRASARLQSSATARWCGTERPPSPRRRLPERRAPSA